MCIRDRINLLKPLDQERKDVGKKIVDALGGPEGVKTMVAGGFKVTRTGGSSNYVDAEELAGELGMEVETYKELVKKHTKKRPYTYVLVKKLGDK